MDGIKYFAIGCRSNPSQQHCRINHRTRCHIRYTRSNGEEQLIAQAMKSNLFTCARGDYLYMLDNDTKQGVSFHLGDGPGLDWYSCGTRRAQATVREGSRKMVRGS